MYSAKRLLTIALVVCLSLSMMVPGVADAQGSQAEQHPQLPEQASAYARGARALDKLGHRLPRVAKAHGLRTAQLRTMFSEDETLFVDNAGELLYFDLQTPPEFADVSDSANAVAAADLSGQEFALASNPGAAKTIYLDFDGHVTQDTSWNTQNQIDTIVSPAYDTDGNPAVFSAAELDIIANSWAVVAEDFAAWNVNITTIDPGPDALRRTGNGDNQWGVRVVVTADTVLSCECGGVAYIGAFDDPADEPAFVFNTNFRGVSESITHEVGHTLILAHDGSSSTDYYRGHSSADTPGWAPIMGSSYWQPVTQWSQQEFTGASNNGTDANFGYGGDDVAIISSMTNGNNFGLRLDDHGDITASATTISGLPAIVEGVIATRQDRDVFAFTATGGQTEFTATPPSVGANLDIGLTLKDSTGTVVATDNPPSALSASLSVMLEAGDFTVEIDGVGAGAPTAAFPSGYTDYGSIGSYTLTVAEVDSALMLGDVNCDGRSTVADALFVSQYAVGSRSASTDCPLTSPSTQIYIPAADVNDNGRISVSDALLISQCVVGLPNDFCPE